VTIAVTCTCRAGSRRSLLAVLDPELLGELVADLGEVEWCSSASWQVPRMTPERWWLGEAVRRDDVRVVLGATGASSFFWSGTFQLSPPVHLLAGQEVLRRD